MYLDWFVAFAPVIGLGANVAAQILVAHNSHRVGVSIIGGVGFGLFVTAIGVLSLNHSGDLISTLATLALASVTYLAFAYGYWAFLNLNITSLRIRMIREILSCGGGISRSDLMVRYSADELMRRRLERMEHAGKFRRTGDHWILNSGALVLLARILDVLRAIILPHPATHAD